MSGADCRRCTANADGSRGAVGPRGVVRSAPDHLPAVDDEFGVGDEGWKKLKACLGPQQGLPLLDVLLVVQRLRVDARDLRRRLLVGDDEGRLELRPSHPLLLAHAAVINIPRVQRQSSIEDEFDRRKRSVGNLDHGGVNR